MDRIKSNIMPFASAGETLKEKFSNDYISAQIDLMIKMQNENPTEAIGKSKELIESCCKTILEENGKIFADTWSVGQLVKETMKLLLFLKAFNTVRCEVLYIALEDSQRRVKKRIQRLGLPVNDGLKIIHKWTDQWESLDYYLENNPQTKVVILDTWGRFVSGVCKNGNDYNRQSCGKDAEDGSVNSVPALHYAEPRAFEAQAMQGRLQGWLVCTGHFARFVM